MSERESDIEFDFFDEPETEETTERPRLPRRSGGGPGGPRRTVHPPHGLIPMLRLAGLVAFLIIIVIVFVFVVRGCASSSKHSKYANYMKAVQGIAVRSAQVGRNLNAALTATGTKETDLESKISGLAAQEQQQAAQASTLHPPGALLTEHNHLIEVFQLRQSALRRLADAFAATEASKNATTAGTQLAEQLRLLVASDVNWDLYFRDAARGVLQDQGVTGVQVPDSHVITNPDLASSQAMARVWQGLHGATTGGTPSGKHGSALVSVTALPDGKKLDPQVETTVTASTDLAFQVAVEDSGDSQESFVKVTLTIAKTPKSIVQHKTIDVINAGETKNVTFTNLGAPPFGVPTTVKVDIQPVPGETTVSNNSAEYKVIFSLG